MSQNAPGRRHPIFARVYGALAPLSEVGGGARARRELLEGLRGSVVEVGCGSGLNFRHYPGAVARVTALEPEPQLRRLALRAARRATVPVEVLDGVAERIPLPDGSQDAVVSALVLCSVEDLAGSLSEVRRVLRPGGEFRFLEHVRGHGAGGRLEDLLDPLWTRVAGGCHLNRQSELEVERVGLRMEGVKELGTKALGIPVPGPRMLLGTARAPS
ncbi:MAG: class I SAM-dependent methyltransferase [Candidatus Dormibacteria bacterium]